MITDGVTDLHHVCRTAPRLGHTPAKIEEPRDAPGAARALARLGVVHERLGAYADALACLRDALAGYRRLGNRHGEA